MEIKNNTEKPYNLVPPNGYYCIHFKGSRKYGEDLQDWIYQDSAHLEDESVPISTTYLSKRPLTYSEAMNAYEEVCC